jgi:hypothetical protein
MADSGVLALVGPFSRLRLDVPEEHGGPDGRGLPGPLIDENPGSTLVSRKVQTLSPSSSGDEPATSDRREIGRASFVESLLSASQLLAPDPRIADHLSDTNTCADDGRERKPGEQTPCGGLLMSHTDMEKNRWRWSRRGAGEDQRGDPDGRRDREHSAHTNIVGRSGVIREQSPK